MIAIFKREIRSYFMTPMGCIYMGFFLLIMGLFFAFGTLMSRSSQFSGFLGSMLFIYLFAIPLLTMRLFSEERRQKTDQLLLTSPVSVGEIVLGKFLAALVLFLLTLAVTVFYALVVAAYGDLAVAETVCSYIGFIFLGASYISIGVFISAGTENQITAALVSFFTLLMIWLIDSVSQIFPTGIKAGLIAAGVLGVLLCLFLYLNTRNLFIALGALVAAAALIAGLYFFKQEIFNGFIRTFFSWFSLNQRYFNFTLGILKLDSLFYYLSFSGLFLFLTAQLIEKRRWN
jgi:ABC-2 type transport system permease protein